MCTQIPETDSPSEERQSTAPSQRTGSLSSVCSALLPWPQSSGRRDTGYPVSADNHQGQSLRADNLRTAIAYGWVRDTR